MKVSSIWTFGAVIDVLTIVPILLPRRRHIMLLLIVVNNSYSSNHNNSNNSNNTNSTNNGKYTTTTTNNNDNDTKCRSCCRGAERTEAARGLSLLTRWRLCCAFALLFASSLNHCIRCVTRPFFAIVVCFCRAPCTVFLLVSASAAVSSPRPASSPEVRGRRHFWVVPVDAQQHHVAYADVPADVQVRGVVQPDEH